MLARCVWAAVAIAIACGPTTQASAPESDNYSLDLTKLHDSTIRTALTATSSGVPYTGREGFSRYVIQTNAPSITVHSLTDLVSFAGGYNSTGLVVNGTVQGNGSQLGATGTTTDTIYSLPAGTNTLELIDGPCGETAVNTPPIRYTPVLSYQLPHGSSHSVTTPTAPTKRIVLLTDSIGGGAFTDAGPNQASVYQAWPILMRKNALASGSGTFAGAHVTYAGTGGRMWRDEALDSTAITASIARLTAQLDGTSANLLIVAMLTNDHGFGTTAANLQTWVGNWADAVNAAFPSLKIVIVSATHKASEGANAGGSTLAQMATSLQNVVTARSAYMVFVSGLGLVTYPTNFAADNLHLKTAGMTEYEVNLRAALNTASLGY